jgi:hypothetical protein
MTSVSDSYAMHQALRTGTRPGHFKSGIWHVERQWYPEKAMRLKRIGEFTDLITTVVKLNTLAPPGAFEEIIVRRDTPRHSSGLRPIEFATCTPVASATVCCEMRLPMEGSFVQCAPGGQAQVQAR